MHAIDIVVVCVAAVALVWFAAILGRQRYMLRAPGTIPLAVRARGNRWQYGVARFVGGELRWYRSLGVGTRPSRVLLRARIRVVGHRSPEPDELSSLPPTAVIVTCRDGDADSDTVLALGEGAYTGFVSWLEASAPLA